MLLDNKIPIRYSLGKIKPEILIVSIYAIAIVILHDIVHLSHMSIPIAIPTFLGSAISLILGFRIAQSYDRWWEARKIWGQVVNDSRSLVRQVLTFIKSDMEADEVIKMQHDFAKTQIAFSFALGKSLREEKIDKCLTNNLKPEDVQTVTKESNIPNALINLHSSRLKEAVSKGWVSGFEVIQIDSTLTRLTDSMGKAERIKKTIFPMTYTILVEYLLYLFVLLLPLGMTDYFGYMVAPLMVTISIPFFLLEKTAIHLQNPFNGNKTDTPVTSIAKTIELNLNQMIGEEFEVDLSNPEDGPFFIM